MNKYEVTEIPVSEIYLQPGFNCRRDISLESVLDLAASIEKMGLQFPITIQPWTEQEGKSYRLVCGHRRLITTRDHLDWTTIPAYIIPDLSEEQARALNFSENFDRKDLNILDEAEWIHSEYGHLSLREAGGILGKSSTWVQTRRRLLTLPERVQSAASAGRLSVSDIEFLFTVSPETMDDRLDQIIRNKVKGKKSKPGAHKSTRKLGSNQIRALATNMLEKHGNSPVYQSSVATLLWLADGLTLEELFDKLSEIERG